MSSFFASNCRTAFIEDLRQYYRWIPVYMIPAGLLAARCSLVLEDNLSDRLAVWGVSFATYLDSTRLLLAIIAVSALLITCIFQGISLTLSAMHARQWGTALLRYQNRDIYSHTVTGIFAFTSAFCLLILTEVQGESTVYSDGFIPYLSTLFACMMMLTGMIAFIFQTHRIASQSQPSHIVAQTGRDLETMIHRGFPQKLHTGQARTDYHAMAAEYQQPDFSNEAAIIPCSVSGYVQSVDYDRLLVLATRYDLVLKVLLHSGEFASRETPVILAWPAENVTARLHRELGKSMIFDQSRKSLEDIDMGVNELCAMAGRSMAVTVNDPSVALNCLDWLGGALEKLFQRDRQKSFLCDSDDTLRVLWQPVTHEDLLNSALSQVGPSAAASPVIMARILEICARLAGHVRSDQERDCIIKHADITIRSCRASLSENNCIKEFEDRYRKVMANLAAGAEI